MKENIISVLNPMCPLKTFKVSEAREPWITNEALEAIRDKDKLLETAKRTKSARDWELARRARNTVGRDIENLKVDFLKNQQAIHKNDPKKFWKYIQFSPVFPSKKQASSTIWLKDDGNDISSKNIPNYMNTFFTEIGPKLASKHNSRWKYYGHTSERDIPEIRTNSEEIIDLCKEIEPLKSSGMDEISSKICKDAFLVLSDELAHLFNFPPARNLPS